MAEKSIATQTDKDFLRLWTIFSRLLTPENNDTEVPVQHSSAVYSEDTLNLRSLWRASQKAHKSETQGSSRQKSRNLQGFIGRIEKDLRSPKFEKN